MVNVIDQTKEMRPLSNLMIRGGNVFLGVENHTVQYNFECGQEKYKLRFSVEGRTDELSVQLSEFLKDSSVLKSELVQSINIALDGAETIGPVGLRCSSEQPKSDISMSVRAAFVEESLGVYRFENKRFTFTHQDFE